MLSKKKPTPKGYILYDSTFVTFVKWQHFFRWRTNCWLPGIGDGVEGRGRMETDAVTKEQHKKSFQLGLFRILTIIVDTQIYTDGTIVCNNKHALKGVQVKLGKSEQDRWILPWLWYYTIVLQNVTTERNWEKCKRNVSVLFLTTAYESAIISIFKKSNMSYPLACCSFKLWIRNVLIFHYFIILLCVFGSRPYWSQQSF